MPVQTMLLGIIPPLLVAAAVVLAVLWMQRRSSESQPSAASRVPWGAVAIALAFTAADIAINHGLPRFPPAEPHRWLPFIALATMLGSLAGIGGGRWASVGVLILAAICLVPIVRDGSPGWCALLWAVPATVIERASVLGPRRGQSDQSANPPALAAPAALAMAIAAMGAGTVLVQSRWVSGGQLAGALGLATLVVAAAAWWKPGPDPLRGVGVVYAIVLVGLLLPHSAVTPASRALVLAAAATPWLGVVPGMRQAPRWTLAGLMMVAAAGLSVLAVWASVKRFDFSDY